jgi:hypothetical protein
MKFSERYGYLKPSEVIIREQITPEIQNAICNCYDILNDQMSYIGSYEYAYLEEHIWCYFLNKRKDKFWRGSEYVITSTSYIEEKSNPWFKKLDLIEETIKYLKSNRKLYKVYDAFIYQVNSEFERLNFGYRIVENQIVEITSDVEIKTIETAIESNMDNVKLHLINALNLYAQRPDADFRNSIKESISAVEALSREITGDKGLSFAKMESACIKIPPVLRKSFEILYGYTNDPTSGIRHALMDETAEYVPGAEEALFMMVSCSAFINYLNIKKK